MNILKQLIKMENNNEFDKLNNESISYRDDCNLCKETNEEIGKKLEYGIIIFKVGNKDDGWFATLSPKTGGNPKYDFTLMLMPISHLTHFSQIDSNPELAKNYGIAFSKLTRAMTSILMKNQNLLSNAENKDFSIPIATYGKSTTWTEKKEHLHLKIFPFRDNIGQPYTVDSSFGRKEILKDEKSEYVKMIPVKKVDLNPNKFEELAKNLIELLK